MTQLEAAKNNIITPLVKQIARKEGLKSRKLLGLIKSGRVVILKNIGHNLRKPCGIGAGLRTKVNANLGTSTDKTNLRGELNKLRACLEARADTVMDLSVGGNLRKVRKTILRNSPIPVGTVPVYEVAVNADRKRNNSLAFEASDIFEVLCQQAEDGVDFFTVHSGITRKNLRALKSGKRILDIVSRGGAIIAAWMEKNKRENPFYEYFDRILEIAAKFDVVLSLGDGLRPGSILDATDRAQIAELKTLGELAQRARKKNVQAMIEGPGHVPLDQIKKNIELEKKFCHGAPFYVLGPLVTDVASGYDHINAAIGAAIAAGYGADFLCYVTASEHLRLPSLLDVREGVIASRIAAHAGDIAKNIKPALEWDKAISCARKARNWQEQIRLSIDPVKAKQYRLSSRPRESSVCTMCGNYCSIKLMEECLRV